MIKKIKNKLNKDANLKELLSGSAITFVLKMGGMLLSYVLIFLISKQLGAEGVGFFQLMLQILTVLGMVLGLGMNIAVLRYVGQFNNEAERPKMRDLYKHFVRIVGPLAFIVGFFIYMGADYFVQWINKDQEYAEGLKLIGMVLPFFTINQISVEFIRGLKQLKISELVRSVLRPLTMILGVYFLFWNQLTKIDVIYLMVVGLIINSLISRWVIWKKLNKIPKQTITFYRKELLKTSYPMMVIGVSTILLSAIPIFAIDFFTDYSKTGIYTVIWKLASLVALVLTIVNTIAAPKFAEMYWNNSYDKLQSLITNSTKLMFIGSLLLSCIIMIWSKFWLSIFGEEYIPYSLELGILVIGQIVNASTGSVGILLNMMGKQSVYKKIILIFVVIQVVFIIPATVYFGLLGVVSVVSLNIIGLNITLVILTKRKFKLKTSYPI